MGVHVFVKMIVLKSLQKVIHSGSLKSRLLTRPSVIHFTTSFNRKHSEDPNSPPGNIPVKFILKDGREVDTLARNGEIALRLAQRFEVPMEGACEASLACTTCHCYVESSHFSLLPEPCEEEEDLLDQAPFLQIESRLGCQIILTKELDG